MAPDTELPPDLAGDLTGTAGRRGGLAGAAGTVGGRWEALSTMRHVDVDRCRRLDLSTGDRLEPGARPPPDLSDMSTWQPCRHVGTLTRRVLPARGAPAVACLPTAGPLRGGTVSRRCASLTLDNLDDLPRPVPPVRVLGAGPGRPRGRRGGRRRRAGEGGLALGHAARVGLLRQDRLRRLAAGRLRDLRAAGARAAQPGLPDLAGVRRRRAADDRPGCCRSSPAAGWAGCWCRRRPRT